MSRAASSHTTKATNNPAHTATPKRETTWLLAVDSGGAYFPASPTAAPPASTSRLAGRVKLRTSLSIKANSSAPPQRSTGERGRTTGCAAGCEAADGEAGSPVTRRTVQAGLARLGDARWAGRFESRIGLRGNVRALRGALCHNPANCCLGRAYGAADAVPPADAGAMPGARAMPGPSNKELPRRAE